MAKKSIFSLHLLFAAAFGFFTGCSVSPPRGDSSFLEKSRQIRSREVKWQIMDPIDGSEIGSLPQPEGEWIYEQESFIASAGERNRVLHVLPDPGGSVRLEFTAILTPDSDEDLIGDITVLLGASADRRFFNSGYSFTTGSFWNNCTTLYRAGDAIARTEWSPLIPNRSYRIAVERVNGHFRYWLDDSILLEAWDPRPLPAPEDRWIGIRTWNTRLRVHDIRWYQPKNNQ